MPRFAVPSLIHALMSPALVILACWLPAAVAQDGAGPAVVTDNMRASLVSEHTAVAPGQTFTVAMRQRIRPHWHTYWRNPGDSGEPTTLDWRLPEGWTASAIQWPAPHRIPVGPLVNFGYSGEVLLLTEITAPADLEPGRTVTLEADAYWLVCEEVCIPEEGVLALPLETAAEPRDGDWKPQLDAARAALPRPLPWSADYTHADDALTISVPVPDDAVITDAVYYPYARDVIQNAAEQRVTHRDGALELSVPTRFAAAPGAFDGLLVLTEAASGEPAERAYRLEFGKTAAAGAAALGAAAGSGGELHWAFALLLAFAGGLILNLMPCVFPVLSIKVLSLVQLAGHDGGRRAIAAHGFVYAGGVLLGFIVLALVLIVLRASGIAAGWGFHLQNPWVVAVLAWLFFLIGLNLSGVFEFGERLMGVGQGATQGHGHRQSLLTGLLATVVATPCTAPFMGAALGYALVQPPALTFVVFLALGAGMAAPFVLLCLVPGWLERLPKPGTWMVRFKEVLAFPMYASAVWLLWVLTQQVGADGVLVGASGAVVIALVIWLGKLGSRTLRHAGAVAGISLLAFGLALLTEAPAGEAGTERQDGDWLAYNETRLAEARANGPVFVNFTADWCITCKANERVALETDRVQALFEAKQVTKLKGDWTRRDEDIARTIERFGRSGVPLYLWYADPAAESPEILPQLLTEQMLIDRLQALP